MGRNVGVKQRQMFNWKNEMYKDFLSKENLFNVWMGGGIKNSIFDVLNVKVNLLCFDYGT